MGTKGIVDQCSKNLKYQNASGSTKVTSLKVSPRMNPCGTTE